MNPKKQRIYGIIALVLAGLMVASTLFLIINALM